MNKYIKIIAITLISSLIIFGIVESAGFGGSGGGTSLGSSPFYVSATSTSAVNNAATTTPCAVQSPTNATSTLIDGTFSLNSATSTVGTLTIAKASTAFATTTILATSTLTANVQATKSALATSTQNGTEERVAVEARIFSPGDWLVIGIAGNPDGFRLTGSCKAIFNSVN